MNDDALRQRAMPVGSDEDVVAAFAAGGAGADVEQVVGVGVGDLDGPVAVSDVGCSEDDRTAGKLEKGTAVDRVVIGVNGMMSLAVASACMLPI